jgi:hypothetical protein
MNAALTAVELRDSGKPRQTLEAHLPPRNLASLSPTASMMYSIIEDVYEVPEIQQFPFFFYRAETCYRRNSGEPTPPSFKSASVSVLACQRKHGGNSSYALMTCIRDAIIRASPSD